MTGTGVAKRHNRLLLLALITIGIGLTSTLRWDFVAGDPLAYRERMAAIAAGGLPYVDVAYEHLPAMLLPMGAAWLAGGFAGPFVYRMVWAVLTSIALLACLAVLERSSKPGDDPFLGRRWILVTAPLLPLLVYRNEPWVMLPACLAILALLQNRPSRVGVASAIGMLAKGWPVLMAVAAWRRGMRARPTIELTVAGLIVLGVAATPGFVTSRGFTGVHSETIGGSIAALVERWRGGTPSYVESAGALYIEVGPWAWGIGIMLGLVIGSWTLWAMSRTTAPVDLIRLVGVLVIALILVSPLQSAQFLGWMTPFVAFTRSRVVVLMAAAAGGVGLWNVIDIEAAFGTSSTWAVAVLARNLLMIGVALGLLAESRRIRVQSPRTGKRLRRLSEPPQG